MISPKKLKVGIFFKSSKWDTYGIVTEVNRTDKYFKVRTLDDCRESNKLSIDAKITGADRSHLEKMTEVPVAEILNHVEEMKSKATQSIENSRMKHEKFVREKTTYVSQLRDFAKLYGESLEEYSIWPPVK